MKILITGGNGQLGSELNHILKSNFSELGGIPASFIGATVISTDINTLDISNLSQTRELLQREQPNIIFNCAAFTNVDACEGNPKLAYQINAAGARNLALATDEIGSAIVHISTDYVFPGQGINPYNEWDTCTPSSVYGHTKYQGERYIQQFCRKSFIVRTAWLYGYTGGNFVKTILKLAREKQSLNVVNDQIGNPTNAVDLAYQLLLIASTEEYGLYHCTNNGECSWYEFACEFVRLSGLSCDITPCSTAEYPRPAPRPAFSALDNQMLRFTIGDSMRSWQDAITSFIKHYDKESGEISI